MVFELSSPLSDIWLDKRSLMGLRQDQIGELESQKSEVQFEADEKSSQ